MNFDRMVVVLHVSVDKFIILMKQEKETSWMVIKNVLSLAKTMMINYLLVMVLLSRCFSSTNLYLIENWIFHFFAWKCIDFWANDSCLLELHSKYPKETSKSSDCILNTTKLVRQLLKCKRKKNTPFRRLHKRWRKKM